MKRLLALILALVATAAIGQTGSPTSGLPAANPLSDSDIAAIVQGGFTRSQCPHVGPTGLCNVQTPLSAFKTYVGGGGGGGTPGGSSTQLQYNNAGAFGGIVNGSAGSCLVSNSSGPPSFGSCSGSGGVTATGSPVAGELAGFSSSTGITNVNLAGDCTTSNTFQITCLRTNGTLFGTFAVSNAATPPAIGGTTPAAGSFTTLTSTSSLVASGTISGTGFSTYLESPPVIGNVAPNAGSFTTLALTGNLTTNLTGSTQCVHVNSSGVESGTGSDCGSGGSSPSFSAITNGTNNAATMHVGTGSILDFTGSGEINANVINGAVMPISAAVLASNGTGQATALTLGNNLAVISNTLQATQGSNAQTGTSYAIGSNSIKTFGSIAGGASYTTGTYTGVSLTGGTGAGAVATIVVAGGAVTSVTLTASSSMVGGQGYVVGDAISATAASIGGTGTGFSVPVTALYNDAGTLVTSNNASAVAWSLAEANTTGYTAGFSFDVQNLGAGGITITPNLSTINAQTTIVVQQGGGCTITSDGTNWQISACTAVVPSPNFSTMGGGTNTQTLHVGTGGTLSATGSGTITATALAALTGLPSQAADTIVANATGSGAVPTAVAVGALAIAKLQATTTFTIAGTGCTPSAHAGGAFAGSFTLASGPCTAVTITMNGATGFTTTTGYHCSVGDKTTQNAGTWIPMWGESASNTTTATLPFPGASGATDVITFDCTGY